MISLSVWFFVVIKLYYESSDRATLSGYPVVFLQDLMQQPLFLTGNFSDG